MDDFEIETFDDEDEWINQIYEKEKELDEYYKKNISFISLNCIYVDIRKNIFKIKKENIKITNNFFSKQEILTIIKKNNEICKKEFKIFSIGKYNFNIDNENISKYNNNGTESFFESLNSIKAIYWQKTIPKFEKMNCLYLFFMEKSNNKTKKNHNKHNKHNKTKKTRLKELLLNEEIITLN